ncbi:WAT1-related protein At4g30420 isoform X2 [Citrus clementina]|uniref:WAT1-related protein At4g30420 isoform X2 n=1 Tax=Citrus clementina TaxID=85681 RepID=UPI000CED78B1|nr:WAT1-related protein At4g30420 isoform X2 [Citrus x clementina]
MGCIEAYKPAMAMVALQFLYAGVALFTRVALVQGLSPRVFVVYRQGTAALIMAPIVYISTRKSSYRLSLGLRTFGWLFVASLIGWEKVHNRSLRSIAKILGTIFCVGGAITMALLKGPKLVNEEFTPPKSLIFSSGADNWLLGCFLLFGSSWFWSFWMILQVPISSSIPNHLYSSAWMCFLASLESATVALLVEKNLEAWTLNSFLELACCLYSGIALAISFFLQAWCISERGPLFCAMFNPLCTVIVTVLAGLFLDEEIFMGSLIGAFAVIIGLYVVLWGKAEDLEEIEHKTDTKLQNDQTRTVQVVIEEPSVKKSYKNNLEEPLLSDKSSIVDANEMIE